MGAEPGEDEPVGGTITDLSTLAAELDTESITFVDDLSGAIAEFVEGNPELEHEYIVGDVSDYGVSASGHDHFDLVHEGSTLHCVVFEYRLDGVADTLEDGTLVAVRGELSYYEDAGSVSIIVDDVLAVGRGRYQQTYQENRETLAAEGYLDDDSRQSLPEFPECVGIATSAESAAREDAVASIHDRHPDIDIVVQDTAVQGDDAMLSMMEAVSVLDEDSRVDAIVLTRGGGADKHLRVFNETPLCRVVHETVTAIVVGIGHETDHTLAEEVADRRVMTPTEVGEIVSRKVDLQEEVETLEADLTRAYTETVQERLEARADRLETAYQRHVTDELSALSTRLDHAHETLEQKKRHEREKADAVASYQQRTRWQRVVIAALVALVLLLLALVLLNT